jgi:hypothetical protein
MLAQSAVGCGESRRAAHALDALPTRQRQHSGLNVGLCHVVRTQDVAYV